MGSGPKRDKDVAPLSVFRNGSLNVLSLSKSATPDTLPFELSTDFQEVALACRLLCIFVSV
jgi:hypothetical protein